MFHHRYVTNMLREFHEAFGAHIEETPTNDIPRDVVALRRSLIKEEAAEVDEALLHRHSLEDLAKELADLAYVVYGTAVSFGIDLDPVIEEVHRSNMSKLGADGKPVYREDGKVLKGPKYREADVQKVLDRQRRIYTNWSLFQETVGGAF